MEKPLIVERYADNGAFSHYALIEKETGELLWSEAPEEEIQQVKNLNLVSRCNFFEGKNGLWKEHHREGSLRLQNLLIAKGFTSCGIGDAEGLWINYSDKYAAGFLGMPDSDEDLYECIKYQLCIVERYYIG